MTEEYDGRDLTDTPSPFHDEAQALKARELDAVLPPIYQREPMPPIHLRRYTNIGPNRVIKELRTMVLEALEHEGGVEYLRWIARNDPKAFAGLLGKVLPMQVTGAGGGPIEFKAIERVIVDVQKPVIDITPNDKT